MQAGNFSRINKRAGGNNAVQVGIFQNSLVKNHKKWKKNWKINKRAGGNKGVQVGNFQKNNNLCSTFIRYSRVHILGQNCCKTLT